MVLVCTICNSSIFDDTYKDYLCMGRHTNILFYSPESQREYTGALALPLFVPPTRITCEYAGGHASAILQKNKNTARHHRSLPSS